MNEKYYIGLDPGAHTGVAIWSATEQKFIRLATFDFWGFVDFIVDLKKKIELTAYFIKPEAIYVEDPNLISTTFVRTSRYSNTHQKISQNVGSNKRDAQLLIELLEKMGFKVIRKKPGSNKYINLDSNQFNRLTGWTSISSQHSRDAGAYVVGLK